MKVQLYHPEHQYRWDQFCDSQQSAWFWHRTFWMHYSQNSRFDVKSKNLSYLLSDDTGQIIFAIVPLIKETVDGISEFTYGGGPTPAPVLNDTLGGRKRKEVQQFIFELYHQLAKDERIQRIVIRPANPRMTGQPFPSDAAYLRYGFTELPSYTSILNLEGNEDVLFRHMSENHQRAIQKAMGLDAKVQIYDQQSISQDVYDRFVRLYFQAAGKVTRPESTFEKWYQLIKTGHGFLAELRLAGEPIGYVYVLAYKHYSYYSMGCNLSSDGIGSHVIHWEIIKFLRTRGTRFYELGEQFLSANLPDPADKKNIMISKFKRHFGGSLIPQPAAEFFYSLEYMKKIWAKRIDHYAQSLGLDSRDDKLR